MIQAASREMMLRIKVLIPITLPDPVKKIMDENYLDCRHANTCMPVASIL